MFKSLLPDDVKVDNTNDDIRLKTNLTTNETFRFTKKSFFYPILGLTQSYSGHLGDIEGCIHLHPGFYRSEKPINITGVNEVHLEADCIHGSIVDGCRQAILFSFGLPSPPANEIYKELGIKPF